MIKREPLVLGKKSLKDVTEDIVRLVEKFPGPKYWTALLSAKTLFLFYLVVVGLIVAVGLGLMGINHPVAWGTDIITFVFWIGIGHAGTLISAILFLFRQKWRTSVARTAEAMTVFAVMTAAVFPIIHLGRPWLFFWFVPYPNQRGPLWINFRSPLTWDVFAISTYFLVSLLFWYVGMLPDLAVLRDRAKRGFRKFFYGTLSLGWRGTARNWSHFEMVYLLLAALSFPLVLSVHSIVSFDFAAAGLPGWHTTIFPPYFVAGAIFSGFGMVVTLMCLVRAFVPRFKDYITINHLEAMNKIIMLTGMMVGYAYSSEFFMAWYSGSSFEQYAFLNRAFGPYAWSYWIMVTCNVIIPQIFWLKKMRRNIKVMFIVSILVNVGMWFERYVIVVTSLHRDFLPSNWGLFKMTFFDFAVLFGSFGMFLTLFLIYIRTLPAIAIAEIKPVLTVGREEAH